MTEFSFFGELFLKDKNSLSLSGCLRTFLTVMMPKRLVGSVLMSNVSLPSPSMMLYLISALTPMSLSLAQIRPTTDPTGADSGTLIWYSPEKKTLTESSSSCHTSSICFTLICPLDGAKPLPSILSESHLRQLKINGSINASQLGYILSRGPASISSTV